MAILPDSSSNSGYQAASASYTWSHTTGGSYRVLMVGVAMLNLANEVAAGFPTYNGVQMTKLRTDVDGTGAIRTDIFYLVSPTLGTNTVRVDLNTASVSASMASSYSGVDQDNPVEASNGATGTASTATVSVTPLTNGDWLFDVLSSADTTTTPAASSPQNQRSMVTGAAGRAGQSDKGPIFPMVSTAMSWTNLDGITNWTMSVAALKAFNSGTTTSTSSTSSTSSSTSSTSTSASTVSTSSTSTSVSTTSVSTSSTSSSLSTSSTSSSISTTSVSTSSTSTSSTSSSTSISSTSSSISSTSVSSTSLSSTSSSTSFSSMSTSVSSTSSSISSTSSSVSSTSFSSTSSSSSTSTTLPPPGWGFSYEDVGSLAVSQVFSSSAIWVAPPNVTSATVECWGGGGGGGNYGSTDIGSAAGGGGGAYSKKALSVIPGTAYFVQVGVGGVGPTPGTTGATGLPGGASWFGTVRTVFAEGGAGGLGSNTSAPLAAAAGGSAANGFGDTTFSGGSGGTVSNDTLPGSGGGGGAGDTGNGGNGGNITAVSAGGAGGSAGTTNGGAGGTGGTGGASSTNGLFGNTLGGGGGGAGSDNATTRGGGRGAAGQVKVTWVKPNISNGASLVSSFNNLQYADVAVDDGDYFIEYGSEFMIRNYKRTGLDNTSSISFTWRGRTTYDTRISPMLIQIYNVNSAAWETLATANTVPPDTDFSVTVNKTTNLSNYYDSNNIVTFRSYQQVI